MGETLFMCNSLHKENPRFFICISIIRFLYYSSKSHRRLGFFDSVIYSRFLYYVQQESLSITNQSLRSFIVGWIYISIIPFLYYCGFDGYNLNRPAILCKIEGLDLSFFI
jgi:hypothetical protein